MSQKPIVLRYQVQTLRNEKWITIFQESSRAFCEGYLSRIRDERGMRNEWRIFDTKKDCAISSLQEKLDMSLGMIAGWPTAEQYELAAKKALERAQEIRKLEEKQKNA